MIISESMQGQTSYDDGSFRIHENDDMFASPERNEINEDMDKGQIAEIGEESKPSRAQAGL